MERFGKFFALFQLIAVIGLFLIVFGIIISVMQNPKKPDLPSVRLQTLESLAEAYGNRTSGVYGVYQVGLKYHEGDVAYFWGNRQDWTIQLEEWRDDGRRNFRVNTWVFTPRDAQHWAFTITPAGVVVNTPNSFIVKMLDAKTNEVAAKLVQAQKLMLGNDFDNPRPFKAFKAN